MAYSAIGDFFRDFASKLDEGLYQVVESEMGCDTIEIEPSENGWKRCEPGERFAQIVIRTDGSPLVDHGLIGKFGRIGKD